MALRALRRCNFQCAAYLVPVSSEIDPLVPFAGRPPAPGDLRVPISLTVSVIVAVLVGVALGAGTGHGPARATVRSLFFASGFVYLVVSIFDFREHFRLEKLATGRRLAWVVVPWGETVNHIATGLTLSALFAIARPIHLPLGAGDWYCIVAPGIFLVLGWRDELVYHRRRAAQREDIMHTTAHLAAAGMLASFVAMRMGPW